MEKKKVKMNNPIEGNPFNIYLFSDENSALIRINNKNLKENIYLKFSNIYKVKEYENSDVYEFGGNSG